MATEDRIHKDLEAFNRHDAAAFASGYAETALVVDPAYPEALKGRDAIRKDMEDFVRAFPDLQARIKTLLTDGNTYSAEWAITATHKGPLAGPEGEIPPTGRQVEIGVVTVGRLDGEGLVAEERRYYDIAGLMSQVGVA